MLHYQNSIHDGAGILASRTIDRLQLAGQTSSSAALAPPGSSPAEAFAALECCRLAGEL